jgi:sugar fermentation stimulation protein A
MKPFEHLKRGIFLRRPNRFSIECIVDGRRVMAYLPNPGRLWELLLPGSTLYLTPRRSSSQRMRYISVAVEKDGLPVLLHTHLNNTIARHLLEHSRIPGLEGAEVIQPEIMVGNSRFDFLLRHKGRDVLLEVKSCTLFSGGIAMFPDAVTLRGRRHLEELAGLSGRGRTCAVLFIAHSPHLRYFMPEYHTDLKFAKTLLSVSRDIMVKAISVSWKRALVLEGPVRELVIPWDVIRKEARDIGSYIIILRLKRGRRIPVGNLGMVRFEKGYYLYVGSARRNLSQRIARHQRRHKTTHWHIDHLRQWAEHCVSLPVRASVDLECEIASALNSISHWNIPRFGSSDCGCKSHLFGMKDNPILSPRFINLLIDFRIRRLEGVLERHYNLAL